MRSLKLTKTDEAGVHVPALLCPVRRAFGRPRYHTEERVCVLIRRTDECTKTESGNAGKSHANSANKLFPEPTFAYPRGENILSGSLEILYVLLVQPAGLHQQLVFVAHFIENTRCSFLFCHLHLFPWQQTQSSKGVRWLFAPPPPKYGGVSLLLKLCVCTKRKLKNSTRRPS